MVYYKVLYGSKTMKRDHHKISTCAIKGCKNWYYIIVRKNASHKNACQYYCFTLFFTNLEKQ